MRIHGLRLGRRDVEKQRVEAVDVFQRPQPVAVDLAGCLDPVVPEPLDVPARRGYLADAVASFLEIVPELRQIGCLRVTSGHPYDGDRVATRGQRCAARGRRVGAIAGDEGRELSSSRILVELRGLE